MELMAGWGEHIELSNSELRNVFITHLKTLTMKIIDNPFFQREAKKLVRSENIIQKNRMILLNSLRDIDEEIGKDSDIAGKCRCCPSFWRG